MKRIDLYITERQSQVIKELAKEKGISFSEMLRRLLDKQLETQNK
jgi:predicted CopG family antitoxin